MRWSAPIAALLVVVAVVAVAGTSCGREKKATAGEVVMAGQTVTPGKLLSVVAGLCDAAQLAGSDVPAALATFYGQSHEGIHLIARGLEDVDRAQAAALLEAKQKVEADFVAPTAGPQIADDLHHLADVTRSSLVRFQVRAEPCPP